MAGQTLIFACGSIFFSVVFVFAFELFSLRFVPLLLRFSISLILISLVIPESSVLDWSKAISIRNAHTPSPELAFSISYCVGQSMLALFLAITLGVAFYAAQLFGAWLQSVFDLSSCEQGASNGIEGICGEDVGGQSLMIRYFISLSVLLFVLQGELFYALVSEIAGSLNINNLSNTIATSFPSEGSILIGLVGRVAMYGAAALFVPFVVSLLLVDFFYLIYLKYFRLGAVPEISKIAKFICLILVLVSSRFLIEGFVSQSVKKSIQIVNKQQLPQNSQAHVLAAPELGTR